MTPITFFKYLSSAALVIAALTPPTATTVDPTLPLLPDTGTSVLTSVTPTPLASTTKPTYNAKTVSTDLPSRLLIPSIKLNDTIVHVGTNSLGEMAVPSGATRNVGWFKDGAVPGDVGSAILDAHVFAAFVNLHKVQVGDDVYVQTTSHNTLHFVVTKVKTFALADIPAEEFFNRADAKRLNLITCAGSLTPDHKTYDHRLIVYTTLVENA